MPARSRALASVFGEDRPGRRPSRRAPSARPSAEHRAAGRMPPHVVVPRPRLQPIGTWTDIRETAEGLRRQGQADPRRRPRRARSTRSLMLRRCSTASVDRLPHRSAERRSKAARCCRDLDLVEISLVSIPCALASLGCTPSKRNPGQRRIPEKERPMSLELSVPEDDAAETAAAHHAARRCSSGSRAIETKAADADRRELATRLDRIETRLARPAARIEVRDDPQARDQGIHRLVPQRLGRPGRPRAQGAGRRHRRLARPSGWQLVPETFLPSCIRNLVVFSPDAAGRPGADGQRRRRCCCRSGPPT